VPNRPDTRGFSDDDINRLTGLAQQHFGPSQFDREVQWHYNKAKGIHDPTMPDDWENPESDYQQGLLHEKQALDNIAGGNPPDTTPSKAAPLPKAASPLPSKSPDWSDLGS
jgi:hypothetical protein